MSYLTEAFSKLDILNEDTFDVSADGIAELKEFEDSDDEQDFIDIIDLDAETEEDLKDSYIGKVILDCNICHSKLYKDPAEITISDDGEEVNVDETCPYCQSTDGFKIDGQIQEYIPTEVTVDVEEKTPDSEDIDDDEKTESLNEAANPENAEVNALIKDLVNGDNKRYAAAKKQLAKLGYDLEVDSTARKEFGREHFGDNITIVNRDTGRKIYANVNNAWKLNDVVNATGGKQAHQIKYNKYGKNIDKNKVRDFDYKNFLDTDRKQEAEPKTAVQQFKDDKQFVKDNEYTINKGIAAKDRLSAVRSKLNDRKNKEESLTESIDTEAFEKDFYSRNYGGAAIMDMRDGIAEISTDDSKTLYKIARDYNVDDSNIWDSAAAHGLFIKIPEEFDSLKESMENIKVETENETITVKSEPKEEIKEEVIGDVTPETETEIESDVDEIAEDPYTETDVDLEEFDEDSFDGLGESYLKEVYENVNSYKTTKVEATPSKIFVEGLITFNSGKTKKTNFVFDANDVTKNNKYRFTGCNKQITEGKKAFSIKGSIDNKKFITESFTYNYSTKDTDGKSRRLYGTVK